MVVVILIENVSTLLMMPKDCFRAVFLCCIVCVSRFPLPSPLSGRIPVVVVAAAVPVALGEKDVLTMILIADVLTLLMMIKDCCWSVFYVIAMLLSVCRDCQHCHCRIASLL